MSDSGGGGPFHELINRSMRVGGMVSGALFSIWLVAQLLSAFSGLLSIIIVGTLAWLIFVRRSH